VEGIGVMVIMLSGTNELFGTQYFWFDDIEEAIQEVIKRYPDAVFDDMPPVTPTGFSDARFYENLQSSADRENTKGWIVVGTPDALDRVFSRGPG
jgi:hypothetical protein